MQPTVTTEAISTGTGFMRHLIAFGTVYTYASWILTTLSIKEPCKLQPKLRPRPSFTSREGPYRFRAFLGGYGSRIKSFYSSVSANGTQTWLLPLAADCVSEHNGDLEMEANKKRLK